MDAQNIKKRTIIGVFVLIVFVLLVRLVLWQNQNMSGDQNVRYLKSLPQFEKVNFAASICVDMADTGGKTSYIDCFVPNNISAHLSNIADQKAYLAALKNAFPMAVKRVPDDQKDPALKFIDSLQPSPFAETGSYLSIKADLTKKVAKNPTIDDLKNYYYLLSIEGDSAKMRNVRAQICKKDPINCDKQKEVTITLSGKVLDNKGQPIESATVALVGDEKTSAKTNANGEYTLSWNIAFNQKARVSAFKKGMANGTFPLLLLAYAPRSFAHDFVLESPLQFAVIDTVTKTITGENTSQANGKWIVSTPRSKYSIPQNALVQKNGRPYQGKVTAYFFEFDKSSQNQDLLANDVFDDVVGYAGNLMKTFGMPYVLFVTDEGEVIHVLKDNAIALEYKIPEMEALRTNKDGIYAPLTQADMQQLVAASQKEGEYPITREFLIEHQMLRFPAFWIFDQTKGIWDGIGCRVVSEDGITQMPFYTLSEAR